MGTLYVVATPIGNMGDVTYRGVETLKSCVRIVCEDTRVTGRLLTHYKIKKPMLSFNEFNEEERVFDVLELLQEGEDIALVTDSGTPLISDPGYRLVSLARVKGINVVPIPGPSAVIAALSSAGLPTNNFLFLGFLPKNEKKRKKFLKELQSGLTCLSFNNTHPTVVIYESAKRLSTTLCGIEDAFGDVSVVVARELTKKHEEFVRGKASELCERYSRSAPKGEVCLLFNVKSSKLKVG